MTPDETRWALALRAATLLAVDPMGLGGAVLRGPALPACGAWLDAFRGFLPDGTHWRRMPPQIAEGRLLGGLDLAATLATGRPVAERGLLAETDGGVLVVPMAERLSGGAAGCIGAALDVGEVVVERDGIALRVATRFAALLIDEGVDDERAPAALSERLAFAIDLTDVRVPGAPSIKSGVVTLPRLANEGFRTSIEAARHRLPEVVAGDEAVEALASAGLAFGVPSLRVATLALRVAKAAAALAGRDAIEAEDAEIAAALVFAPRATAIPATDKDEDSETDEPPRPPPEAEPQNHDAPAEDAEAKTMSDSVVEATRAAIPTDLLATLGVAASAQRAGHAGRAGIAQKSAKRGRPAGTRRGMPGHGVRLAIVETLRAAAPWQKLRRQMAGRAAPSRIFVRREDFRVGRFKEKSETLTIFAVDASGSAALHRLTEVKGAVELILAECYVRRDCVALIAFRGSRAELVLPPTRSLTRAKRALAGQPGGGGTPLAAAIDASRLLAQAARKKGQTPLVVLLTDGKANISRAGLPGRAEAETDAMTSAQAMKAAGLAALVLDIAPRPGPAAARLATTMGARYIPLPYADARLVSRAVLAAGPTA